MEHRSLGNGKKVEALAEAVAPEQVVLPDIQSVTLDGKRFYLVPKKEAQETTINGRVYWLVPVTP